MIRSKNFNSLIFVLVGQLCLTFISAGLFLTAAMAQTPLEGMDCSLEPGERASVFQEPVRPARGKVWEITNDFGNVVTRADVPGLPPGFWQHTGVDYLLGGSSKASEGQTVYAAGSGVVAFSTKSNPNPLPRRGGLVIIRHLAPDGEEYKIPGYEETFTTGAQTFTISYPAFETEEILTYYLHLDPDQIFVSQGDQVTIGMPIAKLYNRQDFPTKFAYPPHLHFEVWKQCTNIERNGYDRANTEFQASVTDLLVDSVSFLTSFPSFDFALDSLRVAGNIRGGFVDNFNDGSLTTLPTSKFDCFGTVHDESGGFLHLKSSDGATIFSPGILVDMCQLGAQSASTRLRNGGGNAVITASFRVDVPLLGQAYGFQLITVGTSESVGIQVGDCGSAGPCVAGFVVLEGVTQIVPVNLNGVTRILLRLTLDDSTNHVTPSFSTDGGRIFTDIPLPASAVIFASANEAVVSVFGVVFFGP